MKKMLVVVAAVTVMADGTARAQSLGEAALRAEEARKAAGAPAMTFDMRDIDAGAARAELLDVSLDAARWKRFVAAERAVAQALEADAALLERYRALEIPTIRAFERFLQREAVLAGALKASGADVRDFAGTYVAAALALRESKGDAGAVETLPPPIRSNVAFVKANDRDVKAIGMPAPKLTMRVPASSSMYALPMAAAPAAARPRSTSTIADRAMAAVEGGGELGTGPEVPDFPFIDFNGNSRSLSEFRGKYLMLDFWGSWCPPCRAEIPYVKAAYERFRSRGFEVLGMDYERGATVDQVRAYLRDNGVTWTFAQPQSVRDVIVEGFRVRAFPTVVLLDPNGRIMPTPTDLLRGPDLARTLDRVLPR